jgi:hypothetical protein
MKKVLAFNRNQDLIELYFENQTEKEIAKHLEENDLALFIMTEAVKNESN